MRPILDYLFLEAADGSPPETKMLLGHRLVRFCLSRVMGGLPSPQKPCEEGVAVCGAEGFQGVGARQSEV